MNIQNKRKKVLVFGEVLWDVFGRKKELGGAPLNFAAHLSLLSAEATLVSALGKDPLGERALKKIKSYDISHKYVTLSGEYPTGLCQVTLDSHGNPDFKLVEGVAYDYIKGPEKIERSLYDAFYFGTLARRGDFSAQSCRRILRGGGFSFVFYDINIRQNYFNRELIEEGLNFSNILKFSREEAFVFASLGLAESLSLEDLAQELGRKYEIENVLVSMDSEGAFLYNLSQDKFYYAEAIPVKVLSSVGAGDSFSAAFLYNIMQARNLQSSLERAVLLSSKVIENLGAIPKVKEKFLRKIRD